MRRVLTTTIGAFPKPDSIPLTDWFSKPDGNYTQSYLDELAETTDDALDAAVHDVVRAQVGAGIDIPTDGEVRRENYIHYLCRHLGGIDFDHLSHRMIRGVTSSMLPTVTGPITADAPSPLPRDFRVAQAATDRPVKITLPGPMTIIDSVVDDHYHDEVLLGADLTAAINRHVLALADAGCTHIQIDEPVLARKPELGLAHGIEHLDRCFDGLADGVTRAAHACCGYPNHLDQTDYEKADRHAYLAIAEALDATSINVLSLEDAHAHNDLADLLGRFRATTIALGVVAIASSRLEPVDEIRSRLAEAAAHLPDGRLIAAPDCGLGYLPRELALDKLRHLSAAARSFD